MYQPHYSSNRYTTKSFESPRSKHVTYSTFRVRQPTKIPCIFLCVISLHVWEAKLESEDRRVTVAEKLRQKVDSVFINSGNANIPVIMGDFNDYPSNSSITEILKAIPPTDNFQPEVCTTLPPFCNREVKVHINFRENGK